MEKTNKWAIWITVATATAIGNSCRNSTEPEPPVTGPAPAILALYQDTATVTAPSLGVRGQVVSLTIRTIGGAIQDPPGSPGCVVRGTTSVTVEGFTVTVEPIDTVRRLPPGQGCTLDLVFLNHDTSFTPSQAGTYTVRVTGRTVPSGQTTILTRQIPVQ
jgi:hypothetical protein